MISTIPITPLIISLTPTLYSVNGLQGSDTVSGQVNGTVTVTSADKITATNASPRVITFTATGANSLNYVLSFSSNGQLKIQRAARSVNALAATKHVGTMDPSSLLYDLDTPLFADDTLTGSLKRITGELVGEYEILQHTLNNNNYALTYSPANFHIITSSKTKTSFIDTLPNTVRKTPETDVAMLNLQAAVFNKVYNKDTRRSLRMVRDSGSNTRVFPYPYTVQSSLVLDKPLATRLNYLPYVDILKEELYTN